MDKVIINGVKYVPEKEPRPKVGDFVNYNDAGRIFWNKPIKPGEADTFLKVVDVSGNFIRFQGTNYNWYLAEHFEKSE
jgi:hypothetical protein